MSVLDLGVILDELFQFRVSTGYKVIGYKVSDISVEFEHAGETRVM